MKQATDCNGKPLAIGDRVRVLEYVKIYGRDGASIRTVDDIDEDPRFPNFIKVSGVLGFANGKRFERVK
jgi:hypothetical protein